MHCRGWNIISGDVARLLFVHCLLSAGLDVLQSDPAAAPVAACGNRTLPGCAKPLTPPPKRSGEIWCPEGQKLEGLNALADQVIIGFLNSASWSRGVPLPAGLVIESLGLKKTSKIIESTLARQ